MRLTGAPVEGRTRNLHLRRVALYPIELRARSLKGSAGRPLNAETNGAGNVSKAQHG